MKTDFTYTSRGTVTGHTERALDYATAELSFYKYLGGNSWHLANEATASRFVHRIAKERGYTYKKVPSLVERILLYFKKVDAEGTVISRELGLD